MNGKQCRTTGLVSTICVLLNSLFEIPIKCVEVHFWGLSGSTGCTTLKAVTECRWLYFFVSALRWTRDLSRVSPPLYIRGCWDKPPPPPQQKNISTVLFSPHRQYKVHLFTQDRQQTSQSMQMYRKLGSVCLIIKNKSVVSNWQESSRRFMKCKRFFL